MKYDIAIIGGGLAGLAMAIQSANAGFSVILFEKESYPHHKVCGEYISMESREFLRRLGLKLEDLHLPEIKKLEISSPSGNKIEHKLDPGGFGISRYLIDHELAKIAKVAGAIIMEKTKVFDVLFRNDEFNVVTSNGEYNSRVAIAAYGKRSNLDIKWKRKFANQKHNSLNNQVGIKYHVLYTQPVDTISLHNFEDGYCGISAIEENKYCLCYLTTASNLKRYDNSVEKMEKQILHKNPYLKKIFEEATFLWASPVTISQISFDKKTQVQDHIIMAGDTAGMITPLCGNGMSMALRSSKIAFTCVKAFLENKISRKRMESDYTRKWKKTFSQQLLFGRKMQTLFGKSWLTNLFVSLVKPFPSIIKWLVSKSHGESF